jgi:DNA-binding NtrC family response regulator
MFGLMVDRCGIGDLMATILIVDDEVFICIVAEVFIQELGHETLAAGSITEALAHLQSASAIDMLFTDIRFQSNKNGGLELAQIGIRLRPKLRVLYTSGSSVTDDMRTLFVDGSHFLQKPYTQNQLQNSMEKLFAATS